MPINPINQFVLIKNLSIIQFQCIKTKMSIRTRVKHRQPPYLYRSFYIKRIIIYTLAASPNLISELIFKCIFRVSHPHSVFVVTHIRWEQQQKRRVRFSLFSSFFCSNEGVDYDLNAWINTYPNFHFVPAYKMYYSKVLLTFLENYNVFSIAKKMKSIHSVYSVCVEKKTPRHQTTSKWSNNKKEAKGKKCIRILNVSSMHDIWGFGYNVKTRSWLE